MLFISAYMLLLSYERLEDMSTGAYFLASFIVGFFLPFIIALVIAWLNGRKHRN